MFKEVKWVSTDKNKEEAKQESMSPKLLTSDHC